MTTVHETSVEAAGFEPSAAPLGNVDLDESLELDESLDLGTLGGESNNSSS